MGGSFHFVHVQNTKMHHSDSFLYFASFWLQFTFKSMHTKGIQNTYWSTSISYHSSKVLESRASLEVSINTIGFAYEFIFKAIEKACSNVYFL